MIETVVAIAGITIIMLEFLVLTRWMWSRDETLAGIMFIFDVVLAIIGIIIISVLGGSI